ncbi:MAG: DUF885 domain-containing protein [Acidimicrobiia bacterium]|nr:MAG: DUF885 domain-containing protein [Acidimicrobiia bacterium]
MIDPIYPLSSDLVDEIAAALPTLATYLGIAGHDDRWEDFGLEGSEAVADMFRGQLLRVRNLPRAEEPFAVLARQVAEDELERNLAEFDDGEHLLDLNSIASTLQTLRDVFDQMDQQSDEGWRAIAARLEGLPAAASAYASRLEAARRQGKVVARRQVVEAVRQARNHAGDGSHFLSLPAAMREAGIGDPALTEAVATGVAAARSGFSALADYLEGTYLPSAPADDAVGEERYVRLARRFLGATVDPALAYEWGWEEVIRLRRRMEQVAGEIVPGGSLDEALELLQTDPARAATSQEEFRRIMLDRQLAALTELDGVHFEVPDPIRTIEVRMTPPGGSLGAYYNGPSEDFSRPGTVWWSKGDQQVIPLFDEVTTAYHEGFPGHHLQFGLQVTAGERLSRLHRLAVWYSGSGEGWALYAEDLMEELGYLEKPDYVMGKLASEMLRACRVVIDIGSHLGYRIPAGQEFHPGEPWRFELGVEMLERYAAQGHDMSVAEMIRYLGWPGQAISYKLGQKAIREMRDEASRKPGFDPKIFHSRLLEAGAIGLDLLRARMGA